MPKRLKSGGFRIKTLWHVDDRFRETLLNAIGFSARPLPHRTPGLPYRIVQTVRFMPS